MPNASFHLKDFQQQSLHVNASSGRTWTSWASRCSIQCLRRTIAMRWIASPYTINEPRFPAVRFLRQFRSDSEVSLCLSLDFQKSSMAVPSIVSGSNIGLLPFPNLQCQCKIGAVKILELPGCQAEWKWTNNIHTESHPSARAVEGKAKDDSSMYPVAAVVVLQTVVAKSIQQ